MPKGYRYLTTAAHGATVHSYVAMLPDRIVLELLDVVGLHPQAPEGTALAAALEQMQGGMLKSWPGAKVVEQQPVTTGPLTGRQFALAADGNTRFVIARIYMAPGAIYSQIAQGPAAARSNPMIEQFVDSLRFG